MRTLTLDLGERSYPILVGHGLLEQQGLLDPYIRGRDVLIVTNQTVGPLYEEQVRALLGRVRVTTVALPDGEAHKTMATVGSVLDALVAGRYGRDAVVLALGGGVVGDIAGFAAAIYQRGIDFVQVPTTLLAQVDSAVGGKTGVNHPGGKNLIGAFHQPVAVVADTATLTTLPDRELSAGLAEVVKYGLIVDADFYAWLESAADALLARDPAALEEAICRCCALKAEVVGQDEREQGRRALLNLGHTFGHAIEVRTGYGTWLHGEAVAAGMVMAAAFSARLGRLPQTEVERLRRLLRRLRLPVAPPPDDAEAFHAAMALDKKVIARRIRLVLLDGIGSASVTGDYPQDELAGFLAGQLAA